jgi:PAS domain S-box-containing protein
MKKNENKSEAASLREKAEALLSINSLEDGSSYQEADSLKLIHELQVHQLELEMQNEELIKAKDQADAARIKATTLYDFAPSAYFTLDKDGVIIELNLSGAKLVGKEREYLQSKRFSLYTTNDTKPVFSHFLEKVFESQSRQSCEITLLQNAATPTYVNLTGTMVENSDYCWVTGEDVTDLRLMKEVLMENDSRLDLAMHTANMAWWGMNIETGSVSFGKRKAEMLGYPPEKFTHYKDFTELLHPDDSDKAKNAMRTLINGEAKRYEVEYRILTKSGAYKWFYDIGSMVSRNEKGVPNTVTGIVMDITERKKAEENLLMSMHLTQNIIDNSPSLFYLFDLEGKFILANRKLEKILGVSKEGLIGKTRESIMPDEIAESHRKNDLVVINSKEAQSFEEDNMESDGLHYYITEKFPLLDSEGNVYAVGGISTDITERKRAEESIRTSEAKWHNLFEILPVGVSIVDSQHNVVEFNAMLGQILDLTKEGLQNGAYKERTYFRSDYTLMKPEEFPSNRAIHENTMIRNIEIGVKKEDESIIWTSVSASPFPAINGTITVTSDITKIKQAEEELRKSEEKWRSLVFNSPDFIALHDREGRFLFLNHYAEGYSEKEVLGKSAFDHVSKESREAYKAIFEKCITTMTKQEIEYSAFGDLGEIRTYESSLVPFMAQGNAINVLVVARDFTERKKTEEEFHQSKNQLAELYKHLSEVREEERTNMAREIHDDLGQSLAGLKLDLIGLKEDINGINWLKEKIDREISMVDDTIKTVRKLTSDLRPQMLDELGLASAIEWQSREFIKRTGIKCNLEIEEIENLNGNIAISLFRIFQASITNIMLHSQAKSVNIKLGIVGELLQLSIFDDGIGISQEQLNSSKSFGIIGMRERANQINGTFIINTQPNKGTKISVNVDLTKKEESL